MSGFEFVEARNGNEPPDNDGEQSDESEGGDEIDHDNCFVGLRFTGNEKFSQRLGGQDIARFLSGVSLEYGDEVRGGFGS